MSSPRRNFILHIEDDEDDQIMLKEAVKEIGSSLEVWNANNGQEGLEILIQCAFSNDLPRLIILDLNMPGMDGKSFFKEIKKHAVLSAIPIVIFTTSSNERDKMFALKEGVNIYTKPFLQADFFRIVKNILSILYKDSQ